MTIGVISDSHGAKTKVRTFAEVVKQNDYHAVIHCGDGLADADLLRSLIEVPVYSVAGNCDWNTVEKRELMLTFQGVRLYVVHGDQYRVKYQKESLAYRAEEKNASIALFGHTHKPFAEYSAGILLVNPGSLSNGQYAELILESGRPPIAKPKTL